MLGDALRDDDEHFHDVCGLWYHGNYHFLCPGKKENMGNNVANLYKQIREERIQPPTKEILNDWVMEVMDIIYNEEDSRIYNKFSKELREYYEWKRKELEVELTKNIGKITSKLSRLELQVLRDYILENTKEK